MGAERAERELEELILTACSNPCLEAECRAIRSVAAAALGGSRLSVEALRLLRRILADAAESARAKGCFEEAASLDKAAWLARVLARALG